MEVPDETNSRNNSLHEFPMNNDPAMGESTNPRGGSLIEESGRKNLNSVIPVGLDKPRAGSLTEFSSTAKSRQSSRTSLIRVALDKPRAGSLTEFSSSSTKSKSTSKIDNGQSLNPLIRVESEKPRAGSLTESSSVAGEERIIEEQDTDQESMAQGTISFRVVKQYFLQALGCIMCFFIIFILILSQVWL